MAIIKSNVLFSGFSGRIGDYVVYELNGKQVVRSLPRKKSKTEASPLQQIHLNSFRAQVRFAKSILNTVIKPVWGLIPNTEGLTYYNRFMKANKMAFNNTDRIMFPEHMSLTIGKLSPATEMEVKLNGTELLIRWNNQRINYLTRDEDQLHIALLQNRDSLIVKEKVACREDGYCNMPLPDNLGDSIEGYLYWSSPDQKMFSPSVYWRV